MNTVVEKAERIRGTLKVPGDKSISHRALILGAIARGGQVITGLPPSADVKSTAACLRALGCTVEETSESSVQVSCSRWTGVRELFAGNSGTTARLIAGLVAGKPLECTIDGDESLRSRPMGRIARPLVQMGGDVSTAADSRLPMRIRGRTLSGITYRLPVASAQVKSAILIAGLHAEGRTTIIEETPTRDHTERMLLAMGVPVDQKNGSVTVVGGAEPEGVKLTVPGDVSTACFFIVATLLLPGSEIRIVETGVNPTRAGALKVLRMMGADIEFENITSRAGEPVADILVRSSRLQAVDIPSAIIPALIDELPVLAVAATQANGRTTVRGAGELRHKESDRIRAIVRNLALLGARIEELEDGFVVKGPCPLKGHAVPSYGDHRIAMAMAVAGLIAAGSTKIERSDVVGISHPGFFRDLRSLLR